MQVISVHSGSFAPKPRLTGLTDTASSIRAAVISESRCLGYNTITARQEESVNPPKFEGMNRITSRIELTCAPSSGWP